MTVISAPPAAPAATPGTTPGARQRLGRLGWAAVAIAAAVALPILAVVAQLFGPASTTSAHLAATVLPEYIVTTIALVALVGLGVAAIGVGGAWLVAHYDFPGRGWLQWALVLPLAMPAYVIAYAYVDALQFAGPVQSALRALAGWQAADYWFPDPRSLAGAALVFAVVLYPYVYLLVRAAFVEQSASTLEAARLAGYSATAALVRIGVPLARPAIAGGAALAMMETLADFGAVSYFGVQTFTTGIFRAWQSFGDRTAAAQLALLLLLLVGAVLLIERSSRGRARFQVSAVPRPLRRVRLTGGYALLAAAACAGPFFFGFVLPAFLLVRLAVLDDVLRFTGRDLQLVANSATLATLAAIIAVTVAIVLAYAQRRARSPLVTAATRFAGLGYAIPGAVIAVGVLIPLGYVDNVIARWMREAFDWRVGLVFTGTIAALLYAYVVRFLAIAQQTVEAGLARITPAMDDAARSLGVDARTVLAKVHVPMLRGTVGTAALLVFVDVMKELPATFALRPFNYDTLAVHIYNLAKDERLGEAAMPSLLVVAVGLIPVMLLARQVVRARK